MGSNSYGPRPPGPPQPPQSRSHLLVIALLILALMVVAGGMGVWMGVRFLSKNVHVELPPEGGDGKEVSIQTPLGSLEVKPDVKGAIGLPIYPGATPVNDHDSATVNINIANAAKLRVLAGKYETSDPLDKVVNFYHDRVGTQVTSFKEKDEEGKTVFEIKTGKQDKIVWLKSDGGKTIIELVRLAEDDQVAN